MADPRIPTLAPWNFNRNSRPASELVADATAFTRALAKIKRSIASASISNPDTAPLATGVTVTIGAADDTTLGKYMSAQDMVQKGFVAANGGQIYYNTANGRAAVFNQNREGELGNFGTTGFAFASTVPTPPPLASDATKTGLNATGPMRLFYDTEAPKVLFRMSTTAAASSVRVLVNTGSGWRYVDKAGYDVSGSNNFLVLDFGGSRSRRGICIEIQGLVILFATRIDALSRWADPTPADPVSILTVGDSHSQGGTNGTPIWDNAVRIFGDRVGAWDNQQAGNASTGWVVRGGAGTFFTIAEAMQRVISRRLFSIIVLRGGYNDAGQSAAAITAAVLAGAKLARQANPTALIMVMGVEGGATGPSASVIAVENAKKAAFDQFADPFSIFVPISTPAEPWHFGTGRVGSTNGSGNSDIYFGPDNNPPHASAAGERYFADRQYAALCQALAPLVA